MPSHLFTLFLALFAPFAGAETNSATGDNGSILDPDGRP
jgi:hypothetical protein